MGEDQEKDIRSGAVVNGVAWLSATGDKTGTANSGMTTLTSIIIPSWNARLQTKLAAASTVHSSKTQLPPVTDCSNGGGSGSPHGS